MNWPKKWIEAIEYHVRGTPVGNDLIEPSQIILDNLHKIGALKDPPKAREWYVCPNCMVCFELDNPPFFHKFQDKHKSFECVYMTNKGVRWIHVKEVIDDN